MRTRTVAIVRNVGAAALAITALTLAACQTREERLVDKWQKTCAAGELDSCATLGEAYSRGVGISKDVGRATTIYRDACGRGGKRACLLLGEAYDTGAGVTKSEAEAQTYFGKACDEGLHEGCVRTCDVFRDSVRCLHVAVLAAQGGKDLQRAGVYYRKACEYGHPLACREIARMHREGIGVQRDPAQATEFQTKADETLKSACAAQTKPDFCDL